MGGLARHQRQPESSSRRSTTRKTERARLSGCAHLRYAGGPQQSKDQEAASAAATSALNGALSNRRVSR